MLTNIGYGHFLVLAALLFTIGVAGVLLRRNAIIIFMCVELMLNAVNLTFVALAQQLGSSGVRVNAVAPGPIWTPLIPATEWADHLPEFGQDTPLGRAGQPAELAPAYVFLASPEASYVSGAVVPVTGGKGL